MTHHTNAKALTYGLDIGGTKMEMGIFSADFERLESWRLPTPTDNYADFLETIQILVAKADHYSQQRGNLGIGVPGIIDKQGRMKSANIPCATGKPIVADLRQLLQRDIALDKDCRLFSLSESFAGAGQGMQRVFGAIIGTGAGGALCINQQLYQSANNIAGEYGHLPVSGALLNQYDLPVRPCGCGLNGCCECYIAGPGLGWLYRHFGGPAEDAEVLVNDLRCGDAIARKAFDCYIDFLGASFASLVLLYDPEVIVVGGGLSKVDEIMSSLPDATARHLFEGVQVPAIQRAVFGDASGVRGAAILSSQLGRQVVSQPGSADVAC